MAEGFKLEIVSPERLLLSETANSVTVPGAEGYFTVMGEHAPLMSVLKPGFVTVVDANGTTHAFYVRGGFADVAPTGLTILAEEARPTSDFDKAEIETFIATGRAALEAATELSERDRLQNDIDAWLNLLVDSSLHGETVH